MYVSRAGAILACTGNVRPAGATAGGAAVSDGHTGRDQVRRCDDRVLAALRAAADRFAGPLVRAACFAAAERCELLRWLAAMWAWTANARRDAEARGSRLRARLTAARRLGLARLASGLPWPRS